jgi:hypothetical protein
VCVSLGSKVVAEISSLESLLALCVCVFLSERPSQEFQCGKHEIREKLEVWMTRFKETGGLHNVRRSRVPTSIR